MGLKISVSTFPHSEELRNELLWAIAEDKSINMCKKAISQICGKKCLVDVVVCVQPPASYDTESDTENAAGRNTMQRSLRFSHSPLETAGLDRAGACSLPDFPSSLINTTLVQSSHIPVGSFLAPPPPFCPSRGDSSSIYSATTMVPLLVCSLECQEQLVGLSCDPPTHCLWQQGIGRWWGSAILNSRQGDGNQARFLRAGPAPWPCFFLRIQHSPISFIWRKNMMGV